MCRPDPSSSLYALAGLAAPEPAVAEQLQISVKYDGYIKRQLAHTEKLKRMEDSVIPDNFDYGRVHGLSTEAREKLLRLRPVSLGQASRIAGVSPADLSILMIHLKA